VLKILDVEQLVQQYIVVIYGYVQHLFIEHCIKLLNISLIIVRKDQEFISSRFFSILYVPRKYYEPYALVCNCVHGPILASLLGKYKNSIFDVYIYILLIK